MQGELDEEEKMVAAVKQVDVVISTLAVPQHLEQFKIIHAIKQAPNIKVNFLFLFLSLFLFSFGFNHKKLGSRIRTSFSLLDHYFIS